LLNTEPFSENTKRFERRIVEPDDPDINLAEAALLIAKDEYPTLDVDHYLGELDTLAGRARAHLNADAPPEEILVSINTLLFDELGFAGNSDNYYDPRNSFLNDVLDRRVGIPITLSIVYIELGRRLGLPLQGIAFPWHFLVKLPMASGDLVLDPFSGGMLLGEEDLTERLKSIADEHAASVTDLVRTFVANPATNRQILTRMLRNLKTIYVNGRDFGRALGIAERILLLNPDQPHDIRDRGVLYEQLECYRAALTDYRQYLALVPSAEDRHDIQLRAADVEQRARRLN